MGLSTYLIDVLIYLYYEKQYRYSGITKKIAQKHKICFLEHFQQLRKMLVTSKKGAHMSRWV